ncbi:MAG: hypothetical protein NTAFB09_09540 [Nitrosospira sp.]
MAAFNGSCQIRRAGINTADGRVNLDLKAVDGTFDWNWFLCKQEFNHEILEIALAAISSNKNVYMQTNDTVAWSEIYFFDLEK